MLFLDNILFLLLFMFILDSVLFLLIELQYFFVKKRIMILS